jgi:hypothetical protein
VQQLFTSREVALAAWLHHLSFDLLVGSFIVREARSLGIGAPWRVPALALTFLFGPAGWLWFRSQVLLRGKPDPLPPHETDRETMRASASPALWAAGLRGRLSLTGSDPASKVGPVARARAHTDGQFVPLATDGLPASPDRHRHVGPHALGRHAEAA